MKKKLYVIATLLLLSLTFVCTSVSAYSQSLSGSSSRYYNGSTLTNRFTTSTDVVMGTVFTNYKVTHNGYSYSVWSGYSPYYADAITQSDSFYWKGVGGLSISGGTSGVGIGVSTDSKSVTYTLNVEDAKSLSHYYSDVKGNRWIIYETGQSISTTFQFGTTFYTINASDSNTVW